MRAQGVGVGGGVHSAQACCHSSQAGVSVPSPHLQEPSMLSTKLCHVMGKRCCFACALSVNTNILGRKIGALECMKVDHSM